MIIITIVIVIIAMILVFHALIVFKTRTCRYQGLWAAVTTTRE